MVHVISIARTPERSGKGWRNLAARILRIRRDVQPRADCHVPVGNSVEVGIRTLRGVAVADRNATGQLVKIRKK